MFYGQSSGIAITGGSGSNLSFENCTFVNNSSPADSLIEITNSTLNLTHCRIENNAMGISGGFVQSNNSSVLVQDSLFNNNRARFGSLFSLSQVSYLDIIDSLLKYNTAVHGGCICSTDSVIKVKNSLFHSNKAIITGGAIACGSSNITFENSSFTNHSSLQGSVLDMGEGYLMANATSFKNNSAFTVITKQSYGRITLENCMFSGNVGYCGAIWQFYFNDSILRLSNTNYSCKSCTWYMCFALLDGANLTMYTWKSHVNTENVHISSDNPKFLSQLYQFIKTEKAIMHWHELPFASGK